MQIPTAWSFFAYGLMALLVLCGGAGVAFRRWWTAPSRLRRRAQHGVVLVGATLLGLLVAELVLGCFYVESDGGSHRTLAGQRWHRTHWKLNRYGFRDLKRRPADFVGKRVLVMLGDSFVAGYGIVDVQDRLSNLLQTRLGDDWVVVNLAKCGWDTAHEEVALRTFKPQPDLVIWSYYLNDIEAVARRCGLAQPQVHRSPEEPWLNLINRSSVANLVYWSAHDYLNREAFAEYSDYVQACYADRQAWGEHRAEMEALIDHCASGGIGLFAVVWPMLGDLEASMEPIGRVEAFLESRNVPFVDVLARVRGREPHLLMVGRSDPHPSAWLNHLLANWVWRQIVEQPCVRGPGPCLAPSPTASIDGSDR